jgi:hypothetical protein
MAEILQFRPRLNVFAPELTSAMGDAYDKAIAALSNTDSERGGSRAFGQADHQVGAARRVRS